MRKAIAYREPSVTLPLQTIHRLQKKITKVELLEAFRFRSLLGKDQFEFVTSAQPEFCPCFGTDTDPIDATRWKQSAVGFDRHSKATVVQCRDESVIKLQEWLATGAYDQGRAARGCRSRPHRGNGSGESAHGIEPSPTRAIDTDEISVAELADCRETIFLTA